MTRNNTSGDSISRESALKFSHDVNNYLLGIEGYAKLLLEEGHVSEEGLPLLNALLETAMQASEHSREIQLRIVREEKNSARESLRLVTELGDAEKGEAILVIDDEEVVRSVTAKILKKAGYQVLTAESGEAGLALFRSHQEQIRCVVLDLTMPFMSGNLVFARLKAMRPDVKVILMSGYVSAEALKQFNNQGVFDFVEKPYEPQLLVSMVNAAVDLDRREHSEVSAGSVA